MPDGEEMRLFGRLHAQSKLLAELGVERILGIVRSRKNTIATVAAAIDWTKRVFVAFDEEDIPIADIEMWVLRDGKNVVVRSALDIDAAGEPKRQCFFALVVRENFLHAIRDEGVGEAVGLAILPQVRIADTVVERVRVRDADHFTLEHQVRAPHRLVELDHTALEGVGQPTPRSSGSSHRRSSRSAARVSARTFRTRPGVATGRNPKGQQSDVPRPGEKSCAAPSHGA